MVTIGIQSIDDIICAYLRDLGFDSKTASTEVSGLKKYLPGISDNGDEVISALDEQLYQSAQKLFSDCQLAKPQQIAMLKFCYLQSGGAQKWGVRIFNTNKIDTEMKTALLQNEVHIAPRPVLSRMEPQSIEMPQPTNLIKKIFKQKKK